MGKAAPQRNVRQVMSGYALMRALADREAALVILDPQYRAILDRQQYGNEGARQKGRAALPQMSDDDIRAIVEEAERVLKPSGHLFLWIDKFTLATCHYRAWLARTSELAVVDLIAWNKLRIGMGRRSRGVMEYLVVVQKEPIRAKRVWTDHGIPDGWPEMQDRGIHPHAKPRQLTERLIRAVTRRGDLVVDPCAGSYGVLAACQDSGRDFCGCDLI